MERELTKIKENNKNNYSISESNMSELEHEINNYGADDYVNYFKSVLGEDSE